MKIMDSATIIIDTLDKQQLTDEDVAKNFLQQGDLIQDSFELYNASQEVIKNVGVLVAISMIIYILLGGLLWALTDQLINKKKLNQFFIYIGRFAAITIVNSLIVFVILMQAGSGLKEELSFNYFWLVLIVIPFYFIFISYALASKLKLKDLAKQTFLIGIKKAHYILLVYFINIVILCLLGLIMYLLLERTILLLTIAMILFILCYTWTRLFLAVVVESIRN